MIIKKGGGILFLLFYCKLGNYKSCKWGVALVENSNTQILRWWQKTKKKVKIPVDLAIKNTLKLNKKRR